MNQYYLQEPKLKLMKEFEKVVIILIDLEIQRQMF